MATACLVDVAKDASLRPPCETLSQVRANLLGNSSTITFSSGPIKEDHEKKRKLTLISVKDTAETNKRLRLTGWSSNRWRKLWEESVGATSRGGQSVKGGAPGRGGASGWGGATGRGGTSGRGGATVRGGASGKVGLCVREWRGFWKRWGIDHPVRRGTSAEELLRRSHPSKEQLLPFFHRLVPPQVNPLFLSHPLLISFFVSRSDADNSRQAPRKRSGPAEELTLTQANLIIGMAAFLYLPPVSLLHALVDRSGLVFSTY